MNILNKEKKEVRIKINDLEIIMRGNPSSEMYLYDLLMEIKGLLIAWGFALDADDKIIIQKDGE